MGRRVRTRLDLVRPDIRGRISQESRGVQQPRSFVIGDRVLARDYRNIRKPGWLYGVVVAVLSPVTYSIQVDLRGQLTTWKRHIDQLRASEIDNPGEGADISRTENNMPMSSVTGREVSQYMPQTFQAASDPTDMPPSASACTGAAASGG